MQEILKASTYLDILTGILSQIEVTSDLNESLSIDEGTLKIINQIISIKLSNHKIIIIGNGGSAAIASHFHNDLCKSIGVRAMVFNEAPLLTAFSNDLGYTVAFENLVDLWVDSGDLLIAISSSGKSENILRAAKSALIKGGTVVTFSGFKKDNPLRNIGWVNFFVSSIEYGYVELIHSIIAHYISDAATKKCI